MPQARHKFQALEAELQPSLSALAGEYGRSWNYESLRRARVSLDTASCILYRKFWISLPGGKLGFHIFIDASPPWRGVELFAAAWDTCVGLATVLTQRRVFLQVMTPPPKKKHPGTTAANERFKWLFIRFVTI